MPLFNYSALDTQGRRSSGTIEAPTKDLALAKLREENLVPLAVEDARRATHVEDVLARVRDVPSQTLVYFARQMATMIDSGMSPMSALTTIEEQEENVRFREAVSDLISEVETGTPMNIAMEKHPDIFSRLFVSMVRSGEESGSLAYSLQTLAEQLERNERVSRAVRGATVYPKVLMAVSFLVLSLIMLLIIPRFTEIFESISQQGSGGGLPLPTQIVVGVSEILYPPGDKNLLWVGQVLLRFLVVAALLFGSFKLAKYILRQPGPRASWDAFKLRAPMRVGGVVRKIATARFARTFSSLLDAGVPAVEALDIVAETTGNVVLSSAIIQAKQEMLSGSTIASTLAQSGVFPPLVTRMIEVGEETGRLQEMLDKVAEFYEDEVEVSIKSLTSIIEPIMILMVGGLVGAVVIAIYLPLLEIYNRIGAEGSAVITAPLWGVWRKYEKQLSALRSRSL
jgi:type IV pilus assembly protein PilC